METTRWSEVRAILGEALELEGTARASLVDLRCGRDADLRGEVERLLAHEQRAAVWNPPDPGRLTDALGDPNLGRHVGPYRLESRLGAGGMGTVYRARRVDFEQQVALKLIKRGMDTDEVLQRFRLERDLLAALRHSYIAQLFDAGASDDGLPWIAMELVEGAPIDRWCDARQLDVRERVRLFIEVCRAVQHAHQHLIVHRDLKPSNILVTESGVPKLLDFGIAKLLDARSDSATRPTLAPLRPLTPEYASPEQARGEATSTATDVYSLGVLLHLLLTGSLPFEDIAGRDGRAADKPSTKVAPGAAQTRGLGERDLRRALAGDLDLIVQTALAAEVEARYASVDALAADAQRHLDGLPIQARRASALYVARKFVARHRVAVGATCAVVAALVAGLVASYAGYVEAERRRGETEQARMVAQEREQLAAREAARANGVLALVDSMLSSASPHEVKQRDYTLRQLLDDFDARLATGEPIAPQVEVSIRTTMGRAYREIGVLDRARTHLQRARSLAAGGTPSTDRPDVLAREWISLLHDEGDYVGAEAASAALERIGTDRAPLDRAEILSQHGDLLSHLGRFAEAEPLLREAVDLQRTFGSAKGPGFASATTMLADMLTQAGRMPEAEDQHRAALAVWMECAPQSDGAASALNNLANVLQRRDKFDEAEADYRRALAIDDALHGLDHPDVATTLQGLGVVLTTRAAYVEAEAVLHQAWDIAQARLGPDHPMGASIAFSLAVVMEKEGRDEEAEALSREGLRIRIATLGENHAVVARAMGNLGGLLVKRDELDEAETLLRRAVEISRGLGEEAPLATCLQNLASLLRKRGRLTEAIAMQREALEQLRCAPQDHPIEIAFALNNLSGLLFYAGDVDESVRSMREAVEIRASVLGDDNPEVARARSNLGLLLCRNGDAAGAEPLLRRALATERAVLGDEHADTGRSAARLAESLVAQERIGEAIEALRVAVPALRSALGEGHAETRGAARELDELLERQQAQR
jgi:serine/threonine-protein kinase